MAVPAFETLTGILLLIPRYRRWGAWLAAVMLIAFMVYIGVLYDRLLGDDCNSSLGSSVWSALRFSQETPLCSASRRSRADGPPD